MTGRDFSARRLQIAAVRIEVLPFEGISVPVTYKRVKKLRIRIELSSGAVRVTAPCQYTSAQVLKVLIEHREWIERRRSSIRPTTGDRSKTLAYEDGESLPLWGAAHSLRVEQVSKPPRVSLAGSEIHLRVRPGTDSKARERLIDRWYGFQVLRAAAPLIDKWGAALHVKPLKLRVRKMKSRWGSWSSGRAMSLNSELAKKPLHFLDYVVLHELCHHHHMNHGPEFKRLLTSHLPQWRRIRAKLKGGSDT